MNVADVAQILVFLVLIGLSAFFSGSETALTSVSKFKAREIEHREKMPHLFEAWLADPNRFLITILVGSTVVNIGASILAHIIVTDWFVRLGLSSTSAKAGGLAFAVATFMLLLFGEIGPKTYAKQNADRVAPVAIRILSWLYYIPFYPFILFFQGITWVFFRLMGLPTGGEPAFLTAEELKLLLQFGHEEGILREEQQDMIHGVFTFRERVVREIMVPRTDIDCLDVNLKLPELLQQLTQIKHSRVPVYEDTIDNVVGVLYAKDLLQYWEELAAAGKHEAEDFNLREHLRSASFVPENKKVDKLLDFFRKEKVHVALVIDEYGGISGLVTIEDVIEEIFGEIQDEYDQEQEEMFQRQEDGSIIADARMSVDDVDQELGLMLIGEDFDTLGGFILSQLGEIPHPGQKVMYQKAELTVLEADERRIYKVRIVLPPPEEGTPDESEH